ncbi:MAG: cytochrome P460 family protein [Sulfuricella sp.]
MKKILCGLLLGAVAQGAQAAQPAPNDISLPEGYKNWQLISPSFRTDKNQLRVILGNEVAVRAAREGKVNPWPDGAILAKLAWSVKTDERWATATVPKDFVQAEFMVKDSAKYAATGGWGFARWVGKDLKPYGKDASFVQECFGCHTPVKDKDYVFTHPAPLP